MTETNTIRFPKLQLSDLEVLERVEKGLEKNNLPPSLLNAAAFDSIFFWSPCPLLCDLYGSGIVLRLSLRFRACKTKIILLRAQLW